MIVLIPQRSSWN